MTTIMIVRIWAPLKLRGGSKARRIWRVRTNPFCSLNQMAPSEKAIEATVVAKAAGPSLVSSQEILARSNASTTQKMMRVTCRSMELMITIIGGGSLERSCRMYGWLRRGRGGGERSRLEVRAELRALLSRNQEYDATCNCGNLCNIYTPFAVFCRVQAP